jgi:hypothetical protein
LGVGRKRQSANDRFAKNGRSVSKSLVKHAVLALFLVFAALLTRRFMSTDGPDML